MNDKLFSLKDILMPIVIGAALGCLLLWLTGCAKIHLECPTSGMETATVGGSTVGYSLIAMGAGAAKTAGFMAPAPGAAGTPAASTVDYSYVPLFGADYVSCGNSPAPASAPTPVPHS